MSVLEICGPKDDNSNTFTFKDGTGIFTCWPMVSNRFIVALLETYYITFFISVYVYTRNLYSSRFP